MATLTARRRESGVIVGDCFQLDIGWKISLDGAHHGCGRFGHPVREAERRWEVHVGMSAIAGPLHQVMEQSGFQHLKTPPACLYSSGMDYDHPNRKKDPVTTLQDTFDPPLAA